MDGVALKKMKDKLVSRDDTDSSLQAGLRLRSKWFPVPSMPCSKLPASASWRSRLGVTSPESKHIPPGTSDQPNSDQQRNAFRCKVAAKKTYW